MMPRYHILQKLVSSVHLVEIFSKFSTTTTNVLLTSANKNPPKTSSKKVVEGIVKKKVKRKDDGVLYGNDALKEYVSKFVTTNDQKLLPSRARKVHKKIPVRGFLIDSNVALSIQEIIQNQNPDLNASVIEINPGLGYLTQRLLTLGFTNVTVFEQYAELSSFLKDKWPQISVINKPFVKLFHLLHLDTVIDGNHVGKLIETLKISSNSENLYVFGLLTGSEDLNLIINSAVNSGLFYDGTYPFKNITYYLLLDAKVYAHLTSTHKDGFYIYRANTVIFQTIFSYECLGEFPRQCFLPWQAQDSSTRAKHILYDPNVVHLLKFTVNDEIVTKLPVEQFPQFEFFIKRHLFSRHNRVIPLLEKWIPNCGPRLIRDGFTIFSQFGDLSASELLKLYSDFISWPGYQGSSFHAASQKYFDKTIEDPNDDYAGILDKDPKRKPAYDECIEDDDDENLAYMLEEDLPPRL